VAGGNGSGKTTFAKILTGLYPPSSGTIRLDDKIVEEESVRWFRSKFSVVSPISACLKALPICSRSKWLKEAERLAVRLKLEHWMLSTPESSGATLSSGERRRLALLMALLEDRPILVFDEWAADQDPRYKDLFYREILPRIRDSGKLVVVISHDERYFSTADRVLWLERGKLPVWRAPSSFAGSAEMRPALSAVYARYGGARGGGKACLAGSDSSTGFEFPIATDLAPYENVFPQNLRICRARLDRSLRRCRPRWRGPLHRDQRACGACRSRERHRRQAW